jgi:hypothetical protein
MAPSLPNSGWTPVSPPTVSPPLTPPSTPCTNPEPPIIVAGDPPKPPRTVAEPGTLALFGIGLAALGLARRRKIRA